MKNFEQWKKDRSESEASDAAILMVWITVVILIAALAV
jgi:hypothetical protein